jgi:hypothetical protein
MQTTQLAHGKITNADTLTIELIEPPGMPAAILFRWLRNHRSPHQAANSKRGSGGNANPRSSSHRTSCPSSPEAAMRSPSRKV